MTTTLLDTARMSSSGEAGDEGRERLVVVGNGMAGARTVEEILQRAGADRFAITVFGEEPYGNYNRILLSNVLCGLDDAKDIFLNPLDWYRANGITLHAGSGSSRSTLGPRRSSPTTARPWGTTS